MSVAVGLGLLDFPFSNAKNFWRWVDICEQGGVDSLWQTDRLVSTTPILECMSTMAALAGATKRIKFGMNVASVGLRDPLLLAKQCATIDYLSDGRLLPAFGIGSARAPDWQAMGIETAGRGEKANEALEIITRLWAEDALDYDGRFFRLHEASISPKPVQKKLPVWLGGATEAAIRRTARYGTGWQAAFETPEQTGRIVAAIKEAVRAEGRSIDEDHFGAGFEFYFGGWDAPAVVRKSADYSRRFRLKPEDALVVGDETDMIARIRAYHAAGVHKFILRPMGCDDTELLDQTRRLVEKLLPEVAALNAK